MTNDERRQAARLLIGRAIILRERALSDFVRQTLSWRLVKNAMLYENAAAELLHGITKEPHEPTPD